MRKCFQVLLALGTLLFVLPRVAEARQAEFKDAPQVQKLLKDAQTEMAKAQEPLGNIPDQAVRAKKLKELSDRFMLGLIPKLRTLVESAKGTPDGGMALLLISIFQMQSNQKEESKATLDTLLKEYLDKPAMESLVELVATLSMGLGEKEGKEVLNRIAKEATSPGARANALLTHIRILKVRTHDPKAQKQALEPLVKELVDQYPHTKYAETAQAMIDVIGHLDVGQVAPNFKATDQDGKTFQLSDYRGKVVVLDFWGFW